MHRIVFEVISLLKHSIDKNIEIVGIAQIPRPDDMSLLYDLPPGDYLRVDVIDTDWESMWR